VKLCNPKDFYYPDKEKFKELHLTGYKDKSLSGFNVKNKIWLERRKKLSIETRLQPYRLFGLLNWLNKDTEKKLDYLDLQLLDTLTGIMGEKYISILPKKKWERMVMLYLNDNCIRKINKNLSWKMGDIVMYVAATILREIKEVVLRLHYNGLYFLVINAQYDSIIEAKMKLARTSIYFSSGYQVTGIGLELKDERFYPYSYPLTRIWGAVAETRIVKVAPITQEVEWVNVFVCGEFCEKIDGELLKFILDG